MLGLHDWPFQMVLLMIAALIVTVFAVVVTRQSLRMPSKVYALAGVMLCILALAYTAAAAVDAYRLERTFDARDAAITTELGNAGIRVVEFRDDWHVVVQSGSCYAAYEIQDGSLLMEGAWPLVVSTGQALSGCTADELDAKFIRSS